MSSNIKNLLSHHVPEEPDLYESAVTHMQANVNTVSKPIHHALKTIYCTIILVSKRIKPYKESSKIVRVRIKRVS